MKLVTVFQAFNPVEADLVRCQLEAAGFHAFLANENAPFYLQGISDAAAVCLQVPEVEVEEVKAFLAAPNADPA